MESTELKQALRLIANSINALHQQIMQLGNEVRILRNKLNEQNKEVQNGKNNIA